MMSIRRPRTLTWRTLASAMVAAAAPLALASDTPGTSNSKGSEKPAYLVVVATITDQDKASVYLNALRDAGLYPLHGGYHITSGRSVQVLEGDLFRSNAIVIAKFPCAAAARRFWFSDTYQKQILPLRAGAGTFEVAIFDERIDEMRP